MKNKKFISLLVGVAVLTILTVNSILVIVNNNNQNTQTQSISTIPVLSSVSATGTIHSENEAILHFQIPGKLVYLPFKEGDQIFQGQTIASLDQRSLMKNIQNAADAYQNQKVNYDITNDFNGDRALSDTGLSIAARRQLETAVNTLDQTQLAVDIQRITSEQSSLVSPIDGILVHEDITVPNQNITTLTSFSVADPKALVFRANVLATDIDFVSLGSIADIQLDGNSVPYNGKIVKIYPQKIILSNGENVYQVDIQSNSLQANGKLDQSGSVIIRGSTDANLIMIPRWTLLSQNFVWTIRNDKPELTRVTIGKIYDNYVSITNGLTKNDRIVSNPETIANLKYQLL